MGIAEQERSQAVADLDTRLAEFDRKLRQIQSELAPGRRPAPAQPTVSTASEPEPTPDPGEPTPDPGGPIPDSGGPIPDSGRTPQPSEPARPATPPESELLHATSEPVRPAAASEPVRPAATSEPERPAATSEPVRPAATSEPVRPAATSEPERLHTTRGRDGPLADLLQHAPHDPPPTTHAPGRQLSQLGRLLSLLHQVLSGIEELLATLEPDSREATIAAGPFGTIEEVREFERRLSHLRGVRDVTVRGYEGAARAIIDVQFGEDH